MIPQNVGFAVASLKKMVVLHRRARVQLDGPQETPRPSKGRAPSSYLSNLLTESGLSITTPLGIENRGDLSIVISFFGGCINVGPVSGILRGGGTGGGPCSRSQQNQAKA